MNDTERYKRAARIAYHAMGTEQTRASKNSPSVTFHHADEDPLAWWCLTEWIASVQPLHPPGKEQ